MKARIANFYGWTDEYIVNSDYETIIEYYEAITVVDAQNKIVEMSITDYSNATKEGRKKLHREMYKLANPKHLQKTMDFEEFQRKMKRGK